MLDNESKFLIGVALGIIACAALFYFVVWLGFKQAINTEPKSIYQSMPK
jgi:hypothetical protein